MEIQQLRCVLAVAEHRSFTKAAAAVHVTQPSLSHAIAKLESEFRLKLFHRSGRGVTPTPAGELVISHARRVVSTLADIEDSVASLHGITTGSLRLAAAHSFTIPITSVVARFRRDYPHVNVTVLAPRPNTALYSLVTRGECDVAFARIDQAPADIDTAAFGTEALAVLLPAGLDPHPGSSSLTLAQVAELPLILPTAGNPTRASLDRFFTGHGVALESSMENDDYHSTLDLVRAGVGACLATLRASTIPVGTRILAIHPTRHTTIGLAHQRGGLSPAATAFRRIALEELGR